MLFRSLLDLAEVEEAHIDAAFGHLARQHIAQLAELEIAVGIGGEFTFFLFDPRVGTFEIEPRGDFLVGLVERVAQFDHVGFRDDVE